MEKTKEILRLHDEFGLSQREIAAATGCSLGTVSGVLSKAKAAGVRWPVDMTAKQLGSALYPPQEGADEEKHTEPDLEIIHREMQRNKKIFKYSVFLPGKFDLLATHADLL